MYEPNMAISDGSCLLVGTPTDCKKAKNKCADCQIYLDYCKDMDAHAAAVDETKPKTMEELEEVLCDYCALPEEAKGVHCYGGHPIMCEGVGCDDAYAAYLEEFNSEQGAERNGEDASER